MNNAASVAPSMPASERYSPRWLERSAVRLASHRSSPKPSTRSSTNLALSRVLSPEKSSVLRTTPSSSPGSHKDPTSVLRLSLRPCWRRNSPSRYSRVLSAERSTSPHGPQTGRTIELAGERARFGRLLRGHVPHRPAHVLFGDAGRSGHLYEDLRRDRRGVRRSHASPCESSVPRRGARSFRPRPASGACHCCPPSGA